MPAAEPQQTTARNVLGQPLVTCGCDPMTGFFRDGCCNTGPDDLGVHTVCAVVTDSFLQTSLELGNDLLTPMPAMNFPGLHAGDRWCVCAARWLQCLQAGAPCPIILESTHENTLQLIPFEILIEHAVIPEKLQ